MKRNLLFQSALRTVYINMCGINAIIKLKKQSLDSTVDVTDLRRMCSSITHRGPDGAGYALLDDKSVGLAHVRLSIIDLAGGDQPIYNEDHSVCIVFNGEIYDYKALREDLMSKGHQFRTHSDTEVIIHLYEEYGLDSFERLNGEFSFVIWDQNKNRLIAARDRCGVKPLFYYLNDQELVISSETKALFSLKRIPRQLNPNYFVGPFLGTFPRAISAFSQIQSLKPGHFLMVENSKVKGETPFWQPSFKIDHKMSFEEARSKVRDLFTKAVHRRMVADVPVGTYLSGGLDSTLVCGLMSQQTKNLKAFNIGFGQTIYDESNLARKIADHYGAQFETIDCNNNSLAENYLKTLYHVEQPLANPNSIAKQILSQLVRSQGYKVCITGEGSDEIFGGYAYFKLERIWRMLNAGGREAQEGLKLQERFQKLEKRSEGLLWHRGSDWKTQLYWLGYPSFHQMRVEESSKVTEKLLTRRVIEQASYSTPWNYFQSEFEPSRFGGLDPFNSTKLITFNQLVNYIIPTLGDRVEMANSVECRTPFLDKDLVEFASTVPTEHFMDITQLREKRLLQKAFSDLLPEFMFKEHKHPFLSPNWSTFSKTSTGKQITSEFLSYESLKKTDIFNPRFIRTLKFYWRFFPKSAVVWKKVDVLIGMVLSTQVLHHLFVENEIPADSSFELQNRSPDQMSRLAPKLKTPSAFSQAPALL